MMSPLEKILSVADDEMIDLIRRMVGKKEVALFAAKAIAASAGTSLDVDEVAQIFGITKQSAYNKIGKIDARPG
jgi:hypothetical protein